MKLIKIFLAISVWAIASLMLQETFAKVTGKNLDELSDREIAAEASVELDFKIDNKKIASCIPRESIAFPNELPSDLSSQIFEEKALKDLMKCSQKDCAFNFQPHEIQVLENIKTPEERKKFYLQFLKNRVAGQTGIDSEKENFFIRTKEHPFDRCESPQLIKLLDQRPVKGFAYRLSHVRYSQRMRPTTRLLQTTGIYSPNKDLVCYAEALIFSDHYDLDRVELWSLKKLSPTKTEVRLSVRHRIDLFRHWMARVNKGKFRAELLDALENQVQKAADCLTKSSPSPKTH